MFCLKIMRYYFHLIFIFIKLGNTLEINDFYDYDNSFLLLENGADKSGYRKLPKSLNFFSDIYDHIYINSQGILTFNNGLNGFANVPLPLEYAAIAPFYSNVDTSNAGPNTFISLSVMNSEDNLRKAYNVVQRNFVLKNDFNISNVIIATWMNVGHYNMNNTAQNTFQVAIINNEQDTFVQFLYPSNGLNWLQGDFGESGLPDIRAQAGFGAEDGRFFLLPGSGSENSKYLSELSNHGVPGSWIYRVGYIGFEENIQQPFESQEEKHKKYVPDTCENGRLNCHVSAACQNYRNGFQCKCNVGFYGNGIDCIKNDVPIRVSGKVSGKIGSSDVDAQIQSYVILSDGRSYTAVSPITSDVGYKSQLGYTLGYVIGWLFAKPVNSDDVPNGYQITGGKFKSTILIRYMGGHRTDNEIELRVVQNFKGLNVWDQLAVDIEINGNLPDVPPSASIIFPDASDTYILNAENEIRMEGNGQIIVDQQNISFVITQTINFETPLGSTLHLENISTPIFNKVSKITSHFQNNEQALRIGMINKVLRNKTINPCTDGTATCIPNAICIPEPQHNSYSCECRNGFSLDETESSCGDIDECSTNTNICDANADCYNELGGYSCRCSEGFYGNGHTCHSNKKISTTEEISYDTTTVLTPNIPALAPNHWLCDQCSEHADCNQGVCVCRSGWNGNGIECIYNCPDEYVWNIDRCIPIVSSADDEENEIAPFCHSQGCSCQTGYELIEFNDSRICRLVEKEEDDEKLPCDVENTCHHNANCIWVESELRNRCVCNPGYDGNGYDCQEHEVSCIFENICDVHASCIYDELIGKSVCKCDKRYEGNGKSCRIAPECFENENCSENAHCEGGACICNDGYERDLSDFCVPSGFCGGTYCANNAICLWDAEELVQYCSCPDGFVGDGVQSCKSITPRCNVKNNCGLNAKCLPEIDGIYKCTCNDGFYGDGLICVPEIDCSNLPNLCHENARCISTMSGYQCFCNSGFIGNGTFCQEPIRQETGFLLLSQGVAIVKIPFEGSRGSPIASSSMGIGLDTDCSNNRVYWCDISTKQILSSKFDGSDKKMFIDEDIVSPEGIAIDWISRRIYWADSSKDTIEVASLDDSKVRAVIIRSGLVNPRGIAVDPLQSKLYFSDWNREGPKIEQSNLDGTDREILLSSPAVILPNSLAISASTGELCFADAGTHKVECIEPFHKTVRTMATELPYPFGLAIANERLYWTDWTTKKIEISDSIGNRFPGISSALFGNHKMYGMTSVGTECPLFYNPCQVNNGDCANNTICLKNPNLPSGIHCQQISKL